MKPGTKQTAEARQRIAAEKRLTLDQRLYRDALVLQGCGQATRHKYGQRAGCDPVTAYKRLRRLEAEGLAESYLHRGSRVFVIAPKATQIAFPLTKAEREAKLAEAERKRRPAQP